MDVVYVKSKKRVDSKEKIDLILKEVLFILILIVFLGIITLLVLSVFGEKKLYEKMPTCGDGTFYDSCSLTKPYFCGQGTLVEKSSRCGCPSGFFKEGDYCSNVLQTGVVDLNLQYTLKGVSDSISFSVYGGINDYVKSLPRSLYSSNNESYSRYEFKRIKLDDELQRISIEPLVVRIQNLAPNSKVDQARIAISLVQNIPYSESKEILTIGNLSISNVSRFPYQVLFEESGACEGKSELLALLLDEIGYETSLLYYQDENHESVGIKCPWEHSLRGSGYCFVETTSPSIITDDSGTYLGAGQLFSIPEIVIISKGISLPEGLDEYGDSLDYARIRSKGVVNFFTKGKWERLNSKYGLDNIVYFIE
ncbi:MAG: hypothetical protein KC516_00100 [Nanoarchaeota archaeon]|nr:hypothetical protein [Nanoarchaeota archaeon]